MDGISSSIFKFDDFELNPNRRRLSRLGREIEVNAKTFDLLVELVRSAGSVVTKDELLSNVWPDQIVEENNLSVHVSTLRKILGNGGERNKYIATISGKGYSFVAPVIVKGEDDAVWDVDDASALHISKSTPHSDSLRTFRSKLAGWPSLVTVSILLAVLVLIAGAFYLNVRKTQPVQRSFESALVDRPTRVGNVSHAVLSPDGKLYAFTRVGSSGLWVGHTGGGDIKEIRAGSSDDYYRSLNFSRNSEQIYFVVTNSTVPKGALYRMSVFGGVPEKVRDDVRTKIDLSPDMMQFVYVANSRESKISSLMVADIEGGKGQTISSRSLQQAFEVGSASWSPDGRSIAVGAAGTFGSEILVVPANGGEPKRLTEKRFDAVVSLAWSRNGEEIFAVAADRSRLDRQLWQIDLKTGETGAIGLDLDNYGAPLGVSDDSKILLTAPASYLANLWIAPSDRPQAAKQITRSALGGRYGRLGVAWMPDGRLVYSAIEDKSHSLWIMEPDGSAERKLTSDGFIDINPSVTADSKTIVFSSNRSGRFELWKINSDGSGASQLTNGDGSEVGAVSPDGRWLFYVADRDTDAHIRRIDMTGAEPTIDVTQQPSDWVRVSPDSTMIACGLLIDGKNKLAVISINGGTPSKIFDLPEKANLRYALRWSRDGNELSYRDWENGYWRQPLSGGSPIRMTGFPEEKLFSYDWSPDGKQIAFSRGLEIRDIVLMKASN